MICKGKFVCDKKFFSIIYKDLGREELIPVQCVTRQYAEMTWEYWHRDKDKDRDKDKSKDRDRDKDKDKSGGGKDRNQDKDENRDEENKKNNNHVAGVAVEQTAGLISIMLEPGTASSFGLGWSSFWNIFEKN